MLHTLFNAVAEMRTQPQGQDFQRYFFFAAGPLVITWLTITIAMQSIARHVAKVHSLGAVWPSAISVLSGFPAAACAHLIYRSVFGAEGVGASVELAVLGTFGMVLGICVICFGGLLILSAIAANADGRKPRPRGQ